LFKSRYYRWYSFAVLKEDAEQLPKKLRFRFLVASIVKEADRQLANKNWLSRNRSKILPLARKLLARVQPLAASEEELLNHS